VAVAVTLIVAAPARANDDDAIDPDRPDVTFSPNTVGKARVQLETGMFYRRTSQAAAAAERRISAEATLRVGVAENFEVRVDGEPIVRVWNDVRDTDVGEINVGLKYRFFEAPEGAWWPTLGLYTFVKPPLAQEPIGSGETDAGLILLASFELPADFTLEVNAGAVLVGQSRPSGHLVQARAAASLSRQIVDQVSGFVDMGYLSRGERDGRDALGMQAGVIWRVMRDLALDAAMSTSLLGTLPDYGVRAGVSVRFGR
jgi:Putative MetA-pathway of phenol degradation